jgi:hypothetical protein
MLSDVLESLNIDSKGRGRSRRCRVATWTGQLTLTMDWYLSEQWNSSDAVSIYKLFEIGNWLYFHAYIGIC